MFVKYLSDVWGVKLKAVRNEPGNQTELVHRKMSRERFVLPEGCTFNDIYAKRNADNIGEEIDKALAKIEDQNLAKLDGVFRNISFNSEKLDQTKDRNRRLKDLLEDFTSPDLNFRPSHYTKKADVIGNAYMYLIERFASEAGKKGGEFYTPHEVCELLARLVAPKTGARICDPTCGSGSLLITVAEHVTDQQGQPSRDFAIYGQDSNGGTWVLAKMNMFLNEMDSADIEWGDTINNPKLREGHELMKFDVVVANPPFSLDKWGTENAEADQHKRFVRGIPPESKGNYAFILHLIGTTLPTGREAAKPHVGLTNWPGERISEQDVTVAKNYLGAEELDHLNRIVNQYLEYAELQALQRKPTHMADWKKKLDDFLTFNDREILRHAGAVSHDDAEKHALKEFERYRMQLDAGQPDERDRAMKRITGVRTAKPKNTKPPKK